MTQIGVLYRHGSNHCFTTEDGIHRTEVGCSHRMPRSAIDHANALASRTTGDSDLAAVGAARSRDEDHPSSEAPAHTPAVSGVPAAGAVPPVPAAPDFGF